jgi:lipopolysaccharide transport system ATP-binding protein
MGDVSRQGRTVLFVSHNMTAVQTLCSRAILLEHGQQTLGGLPHEIIRHYLGETIRSQAECVWNDPERAPGNHLARLHGVRVLDSGGATTADIRSDDEFSVELTYWARQPGAQLGATVILYDDQGVCVLSSPSIDESRWHGKPRPVGLYRSRCHFPATFLAPGQYTVKVYLWSAGYRAVCYQDEVVTFEIIDAGELRQDYFGEWGGVVRPRLAWTTEEVPAAETWRERERVPAPAEPALAGRVNGPE